MQTLLPFLPALIVFFLGIVSHRIVLSLLVGIISACLIATSGSVIESILLIKKQLLINCELHEWNSWDSFIRTDKLFVIVFILASGILFALVKRAGGIEALVNLTSKKIQNAKSAETASLLLSHSLFIDGCLSSIAVSSIMRPLSSRFKVSRVKIALLADSMSGPLVVLCPFSCFTALIIGLLSNNGIHTSLGKETLLLENPNSIYFMTLPYVLYSITIIATFWFIVRTRLSLRIMRKYENSKDPLSQPEHPSKEAKGADFFIPMLLFSFFLVFFTLLLDKGNFSPWEILIKTPISFVLFASSTSALVLSLLYYGMWGRFRYKEMGQIILSSLKSGLRSAAIIFLAWMLADILKDNLHIGVKISELLSGSVSAVFLPLIFFWISSLVSASLGTAWGTIAIFIPLAAPTVIAMLGVSPPVALDKVPLLLPTLGGIISGAAFGDHISLLSDSTILSSAGAKCHLIDHFKTQVFYAIPVFIGASLGFLALGITTQKPPFSFLPLIISIATSLGILSLMRKTPSTTDGKSLSSS